jgi:hypothetical protein
VDVVELAVVDPRLLLGVLDHELEVRDPRRRLDRRQVRTDYLRVRVRLGEVVRPDPGAGRDVQDVLGGLDRCPGQLGVQDELRARVLKVKAVLFRLLSGSARPSMAHHTKTE